MHLSYIRLSSSFSNKLYPNHIPTTFLQKSVLCLGSAIGAIINPERADYIATIGDTTCSFSIPFLIKKMNTNEEGKRILKEKPNGIRFTDEQMNYFLSLPESTLGGLYSRWMKFNSFQSKERPLTHFVDDIEGAYIIQRYREAHDLFHVLLGLEATVQEELALKWFEFLQTGLPVGLISTTIGPIRLPIKEMKEFYFELIPWATNNAKQSELLMNIYYEEHMEDDINQLRSKLNIIPFKNDKQLLKQKE